MLLKELKSKTDDKNLFDFIDYFNDIPDTKPYYNEFILKYGNREMIQAISELDSIDGLGGIGMIFVLKSEDWKNAKLLNDKINQLSIDDKKVTTTKTDQGNTEKNRTNTESRDSTENVVPYDIDTEIKSNTTTNGNTSNDNETLKDDRTGTNETVYTGFSKDRLQYLERFKDQPDYRNTIYNSIVNMLCLQIY